MVSQTKKPSQAQAQLGVGVACLSLFIMFGAFLVHFLLNTASYMSQKVSLFSNIKNLLFKMTETKNLTPAPVPPKKALQSQSTTDSSLTPPSSIQSDNQESLATATETDFQAELCGSDRQNFVYIRSIEPSNLVIINK
jgi:hypothetical protein